MEKILAMLAHEQDEQLRTGAEVDLTVELVTGQTVTGIIESTADGILSMRRLHHEQYYDTPRHYAISAVIAAYYTGGS